MNYEVKTQWEEINSENELYSTGHYLITAEEMNSILEEKKHHSSWKVTVLGNSQIINIDSKERTLSLQFLNFNNPSDDQQQYIMEIVASSKIVNNHHEMLPDEVNRILASKKTIEYRHF